MKGSAIVQGLKSWASALHPQLPLSRKESQRLLNALTSSFRRQLDEAHPPQSSGDGRPQVAKASETDIKSGRSQGLHSSSSVFADRHLASVLTSPLLAPARAAKRPDVATAMVELRRHPAKDPIELLEEYHERGHATIPIAVTCIEAFTKSLEALPGPQRKDAITKTLAGRRILQWVWKSKIYENDQFVKESLLSDVMVSLVLEEGFEEDLWKWLAMDVAVPVQQTLPKWTSQRQIQMHPYRWKAVTIRGILAAKLRHGDSFDVALQAFCRALDLKDSYLIHLASSYILISKKIREDDMRRLKTDGKLYDRLVDFTRSDWLRSGSDISMPELDACSLVLLHPTKASPLPALRLLRRVFGPKEPSVEWRSLRSYFQDSRSDTAKWRSYRFCVRTITRLEEMGRAEDAAWVISKTTKFFGDLTGDFAESLAIQRRRNDVEGRMPASAPVAQQEQAAPERLSMPSFAI